MIFNEKYSIGNLLGKGSHGKVYSVTNSQNKTHNVAIKIEKCEKNKPMINQRLFFEYNILKILYKNSNVVHKFGRCSIDSSGVDCFYILMKRYDFSLNDLNFKSIPLSFIFKFAIVMLNEIKFIHDNGIIHRDIKPSNIMFKLDGQKIVECKLIDFGLARKYTDEHGNLKNSRGNIGFRGSLRYVSVNGHQGKELSRADDLWSLFYVVLELVLNKLPWNKKCKSPSKIEASKKRIVDDLSFINKIIPKKKNPKTHEKIINVFNEYINYLKTIKYEQRPDYDKLINIFKKNFDSNMYDELFPIVYINRKKIELSMDLSGIS